VQSELPDRAVSYRVARRKWLPDFVARRLFGAPLAPRPEEWAAVRDALWRGDPPMDELVSWMLEQAPRRALFERALTQGLASIEDPPAPLARFFAQLDAAPAWLERRLVEDGARAAQQVGMAGFYVLRDLALMGGYVYFNSMNQTLVATGALSKDVTRRLGATGQWLAQVVAPAGLARFGSGFIATIRVRMVHALVRRAVDGRKDWQRERWAAPINQIDMMATYLAFGPVTLLGAQLFGVPLNRAERRAAMHMWRYVGWLMGVEEQWLASSQGDGLRKLYHASLTHRLPDQHVRELGAALRDEPLARHLPELAQRPFLRKLVRRYLYHKHIANSALILGPLQRHRLGLPWLAVPWYLALSAPLRFVQRTWYRWRGGAALEAHIRRDAAEQEKLLASYLGSDSRATELARSTEQQELPHG
jgi:hypothetical protein